MKKQLFAVCAVAGLIVSLAGPTLAHDEKSAQPGEKIERSLTVDAQATITLCVASGTLTVNGWDKNEVRVRSTDAAQIDFRRIDKVKNDTRPASRVDVMVYDKNTPVRSRVDCQALASVEMEVPAGATVQVQTRDGDIMISGIAAAYAGSQNGDITIERATKLVEAGSVGGSISLRNSSGRVFLNSAGGGVEAINIKPATTDDTFEVGTVSGDIQLDHVSNPKVMAKTVNGVLYMSGPLAKQGYYSFSNVTGDVEIAMPRDASFQLNAKVSEKHNIVSDFPLKYISEPTPPAPAATPRHAPKTSPEATPKPPKSGPEAGPITIERPALPVPYVPRRITAVCGTGDATLSIATFGGTVRLKKL